MKSWKLFSRLLKIWWSRYWFNFRRWDSVIGLKERLKIARKIINKAAEYGIGKENIIIDCLTLTASAQQKEVSRNSQSFNFS